MQKMRNGRAVVQSVAAIRQYALNDNHEPLGKQRWPNPHIVKDAGSIRFQQEIRIRCHLCGTVGYNIHILHQLLYLILQIS